AENVVILEVDDAAQVAGAVGAAARVGDLEPGRVAVAGNLTRYEVAVLVHQVAERVLDVRPEHQRVRTRPALCGESDLELRVAGAGHDGNACHGDVASGPGEADDVVERECVWFHGPVVGHAQVIERTEADVAGRLGDHTQAGQVEPRHVGVLGLAGNAV